MKAYLIAWFSTFVLAASLAAEEHPILALGSLAPEFDLTGVDGRYYTLKDFADAKVLAVVFIANHCPTAQYTAHWRQDTLILPGVTVQRTPTVGV